MRIILLLAVLLSLFAGCVTPMLGPTPDTFMDMAEHHHR